MTGKLQGQYLLMLRRYFDRDTKSWTLELLVSLTKHLSLLSIKRSRHRKNIFTKNLAQFLSVTQIITSHISKQNRRGFSSRIWNLRVKIRRISFISRLFYFILIGVLLRYLHIFWKLIWKSPFLMGIISCPTGSTPNS